MARSRRGRRTPARPATREIAAVESAIAGGLSAFLAETPDPRRRRFASLSGPALFRETLRDEKAVTSLNQLLDAVSAIPWKVEPGVVEDAKAERAADELREALLAIDFNAAFREMLHCVWYGYAVAELIWEPGPSRVELADIRTRAPERFRFAPDGSLRLLSRERPHGVEVPEAKFWVARMPAEHGGRAHGPGAAPACFWPVWLKRNGLRFWAVALEKFGAATATVRRDASPEEVEHALETLRRLAAGTDITLTEGQEIKLLEATRRSGGDHAEFCRYMDTLIVEAILLQTATTDMGPWKGTAEVQKLVRDERVATLARLVCESFNRTAARWLTDWNFPGAPYPRVVREVVPPEDLNERVRRDEIIARMSGRLPDPAYIEATYGGKWLPAPPSATPVPGARFAAPATPDAIARGVDAALDGWAPLMEPLVQPVLDAARETGGGGAGFDDFRARLDDGSLIERMDAAPATRALHRTAFSAAASGELGLVEDTGGGDSDDG